MREVEGIRTHLSTKNLLLLGSPVLLMFTPFPCVFDSVLHFGKMKQQYRDIGRV